MREQEKISPLIRIASGVIGVLGFAAIAFNATNDGGLQLTFITFASFLAGFIFSFVSFFGKYPWDKSRAKEPGE